MDSKIAEATTEKGLILTYTGNGKAVATSVVARALGHGMRVGIVQLIKGSYQTGEEAFFRRFPDEVWSHLMSEGFAWESQDKERDIAAASAAKEKAAAMLRDPAVDLILLDELNIALKYKYFDLTRVMQDIQARPAKQHGVTTGRRTCRVD